jgi:hypothetical protein
MQHKQADGIPPDWTPETIARAGKALAAWEAAYNDMIRKKGHQKISAGELHQAALQTRIARGGNPAEPLSMADYGEASQALQTAAATLREMEEDQKIRQSYLEHLKLIEPLLTDKERQSGKITFARAVAITTGNHDRPKDYRKPGRWIKDFLKKHREGMQKLLREHLRSVQEVEEEFFADVPALRKLVEWTPYDNLKQDDLLTLEEFAGMHSANWFLFKQGGALMRKVIEGKNPSHVQRVLGLKEETIEALAAAKVSPKKVLGRPSGQPKKPAPRKAKKSRTKAT